MGRIAGTNLLRIGDLARLAGVTPRTLRYYESLGLIQPHARSSGKYRLYSNEQLTRLRSVLALKRAGLELEEICECRRLARQPGAARDVARDLRSLLEGRTRLVRNRIAELKESLAELNRTRVILDVCCRCEGSKLEMTSQCLECWNQRSGAALPAAIEALI
jgi:DNA-binding transcriptional MerR regulator